MTVQEPPVFNGRYELQRRLARGGMAEVFLARDLLLDRPVAVKVLFPEFATDPAFVARFRREAQAAANLNHPNIVGVYDWGQEDGTYFIVMEYVDGRSLSDILRTEGLPPPDAAADIATDVAAALGFAHRNGVVHRDVKPGNILITAAGQVKVADFGIARAIAGGAEENLTQTGSVMGTATYFSPEQAQGHAVDPRSDLYSLGVVMYEMAHRQAAVHRRQPGGHRLQARAGAARPAPPGQPGRARRPSRRSRSSCWPSGPTTATRPPTTCAPTCAASCGASRCWPTRRPSRAAAPAAAPTQRRRPSTRRPPRGAVPAAARRRPHRRTGWFLLVLFLLLAVLGGLLVAFAYATDLARQGGRRSTVPNVVNDNAVRAIAELRKAGFVVDYSARETSDTVAKDCRDPPGPGRPAPSCPKGDRVAHRHQQRTARGRGRSRCPTSPVGEAQTRGRVPARPRLHERDHPATAAFSDDIAQGAVLRTDPAGRPTRRPPSPTTDITLFVSQGEGPGHHHHDRDHHRRNPPPTDVDDHHDRRRRRSATAGTASG